MVSEPQKRTLSVEEWCRLAGEGVKLPVCICVHGVSMQPLIRLHRDRVTILPMERLPRKGDVVLFHDPERSRYVLHRVWAVRGERVLTWGDNCVNPDGWMSRQKVLGLAVTVERGRRTIRLDTRWAHEMGMLLARTRHGYLIIRSAAFALARHLPKRVRTVLKSILVRGRG